MNYLRLLLLWIVFTLVLSACSGNSNSPTAQTDNSTTVQTGSNSTVQTGNNPTSQTNSNQMGGAIQTNLPALSQSVTTVAGVTSGYADGIGTAALFDHPASVTTDGANLFVADSNNHIIRKIVLATGAVTTLAGAAGTSGATDGIRSEARFSFPTGITTDGINLYVVDRNFSIRKVEIATGVVTTLAGTTGLCGWADGIGTESSFCRPAGITTDGTNLYVADNPNSGATIRKIVIATGAVTTLAGTANDFGTVDGIGSSARLNYPVGITTDGINLYVTEWNGNAIRKIVIATGAVTTLAGTASTPGSNDGIGTAAGFSGPFDITADGANLYLADYLNHTIRKIVIATGAVTTLAGTAGTSGSIDGTGFGARFYYPRGITTDGTNLYVADTYNNTIRKIQ